MGKFGKGTKGSSSVESETFSVDKAEFEEGVEKSKKGGGGGDFSEPVPTGRYLIEVIEAERNESTWDDSKGAPQYDLTLEIVDGDSKKRRLWLNRNIIAHKGKSFPGYLKFLDAIGIPSDSYDEDSVPLPKIATVIGARFWVDVKHTKGKGANADKVYANPFIVPIGEVDDTTTAKPKKDKKKAAR